MSWKSKRVQILTGPHRGKLGMASEITLNGKKRLRLFVHFSKTDLVFDHYEIREVPNHGDEDTPLPEDPYEAAQRG